MEQDTLKWRRAKAGRNFGKDTIIIPDGDPDPRLVKCAVNDCKYIFIEDLKKLPVEGEEEHKPADLAVPYAGLGTGKIISKESVENEFWKDFRRCAAKDLLGSIVANPLCDPKVPDKNLVTAAINLTNELINQLKATENETDIHKHPLCRS